MVSPSSAEWPVPAADDFPVEEIAPDSELPVKQGDVLAGRYAVERVLASGGMGVVCLGRHVELDQPVAVKFLRRELAQNPAVVQRFLNEARAAASLRSEHVVRVIDVAELTSGRPYLVMEHLDGVDLGALVEREGALEPSRALGYVLDVCAALEEAHAAGIVHRDIKPENLILCVVSGREVVKVVDFGLAKRIDSAKAIVVTDPREGMGSPCYMSPEQIATPHAVDVRTDIWSLGVVLYRLVSGALPFDGDSISEVCARVLNAAPRPLTELRPGLDAALEAIVQRCLEKQRDARFASIAELVQSIREYRASALSDTQPTTVPPPTSAALVPSEAPAALTVRTESSRRFVLPFTLSLIAFVVMGASLGFNAAGSLDRIRELADMGRLESTAEEPQASDVVGHPRREMDISGVAPGVCTVEPKGAGFLLAERERAKRHHHHDDDSDDGSSTAAPEGHDDTEPGPAEIARRERRYRRYLDRHGYKPIREVLQQMERSSGSESAGSAPSRESGPSDTQTP
jgi:serine/threonine-protein kinase